MALNLLSFWLSLQSPRIVGMRYPTLLLSVLGVYMSGGGGGICTCDFPCRGSKKSYCITSDFPFKNTVHVHQAPAIPTGQKLVAPGDLTVSLFLRSRLPYPLSPKSFACSSDLTSPQALQSRDRKGRQADNRRNSPFNVLTPQGSRFLLARIKLDSSGSL